MEKSAGFASGVVGKLKGGFGALGKVAAVGFAGAAAGAVGLGVGLVKLASNAGKVQGVTDAFEGLTSTIEGGSADMLAALKEGSLGMVNQTELMMGFNKAAQLVGIDFAQNLPDAMSYLSKVSAATGQDMGFMIDSLITGVGRLSPMILDNLGIQVALSDATARASEMFGVEAGELTKAQTQAGMMNVVLEKLQENTAAMPEVAGTAAQAQAALSAQLQDTKDAIGVALLPVWNELMQGVLSLAQQYLPILIEVFKSEVVPWIQDKVVPAIGDLVSWLSKNLPGAMSTVAGFWSGTLKPALEAVAAFIQNPVIPWIEKLVGWLQENVPKAMQTARDIWNSVLKPALEALWQFIQDPVIPWLEKFVSWVEDRIPEAMTAAQDVWNSVLKPALTALWEFIKDPVIPIIEKLFNWLNTNVPRAMRMVKGVWENALKPALSALWGFIQDPVIPIIERFVGWLSDKIPDAFATVVRWWNQTGKPIWEKIRGAIQMVVDVLEKIIEYARKVTDALGSIKVPEIKLPSIHIPDWLIPGSATPLEIGIRGVSDALREMRMDWATMGTMAGVGAGGGGTSIGRQVNVTVDAHYRNVQSEASLVDDMRMLAQLYG